MTVQQTGGTMNVNAIQRVIDNDPDLKHDLYVLVEKADMSQFRMEEQIKGYLQKHFHWWKDSTEESCPKHDYDHMDMLMFALLQSAIDNISDEDLSQLASHYIKAYEKEHC